MIRLTKETLNASVLGEVVFCSIAGLGAMGSPGTVIFANRSNKWYSVRFCRGEVPLDDIYRAFPPLQELNAGEHEDNSKEPVEWHHMNLGFGNYLMIHASVYSEFMRQMGPDKSPSEAYQAWDKCAYTVLADMYENSVSPRKITIISELLVYGPRPEPGDDIQQTLTINDQGRVWFSTKTYGDNESWQVTSGRKAQTHIDGHEAMALMKRLAVYIKSHQQTDYVTDIGHWDLTMAMRDGSVLKVNGSMYSDTRLDAITKELRELLPDLDIAGFGYHEGKDGSDCFAVGTEVYNTTFGYGVIKSYVDQNVKVTFQAGEKSFRVPDAFDKKILVYADEPDSCLEPMSPISSIQIEKSNASTESIEQITVWAKKAKGRINSFDEQYVLSGTWTFNANLELRKYLFDYVTKIDQEEPWRQEYRQLKDGTGVKFTITYSTGHSKHVYGHINMIPHMLKIDGIIHLLMAPGPDKDIEITYVAGTKEPVFTYWFEELYCVPWDDVTSSCYAWPFPTGAPDRFISEYKKYVLMQMEAKKKKKTDVEDRRGRYVHYSDKAQNFIFGKVATEVASSFPVSVNLAMSKEQALRLGRGTVVAIMPDLPNSKDVYYRLYDLPKDKVTFSGDSWERIVDIPRSNIVEIMKILYPEGLDNHYWSIISAIEGDTIRLIGFGD